MRVFRHQSAVFVATSLWVIAPIALAQSSAKSTATIQRIALLAGHGTELEIAADGPVTPRAQVITGPDRLVIDFPNSLPAKGLHNLEINRGGVTDARIGLFASNPPVTRVVVDLKSSQSYQLFPSGKKVVVKFGENSSTPAASSTSDPSSSDSLETVVSIERSPVAPASQAAEASHPPAQAASGVEVSFDKGLLSIRANKANLSDVLSEVHRRTGAEIAIPPGAESEQVFTTLGPGSPKEVLASLLNGSHFNFIVIGSERDPAGIRQVVLTPKQGGVPEAVTYPCGTSQPSIAQTAPDPSQQPVYSPPPPPEPQPGMNEAPPGEQPPPPPPQ